MQPRSLTPEQVRFFHDEGYLILNDLFPPQDLEPLKREMADQIDQCVRRLSDEGKIGNLHATEPFETRLARIHADSADNGKAIIRDLEGVAGGGFTGREMFNLIRHPNILAAIESIVGPEIVGSSVYRVRPKVPGRTLGVVPWHQDSGYFERLCDTHTIVTCWVPLVDANVRNGCMQILPRSHKRGILTHHTGGNAGFLVIEDQDLPTDVPPPVTAEVRAGGIVLMTNLTPHSSTPNHMDHVRWSVDLRYQSADAPNNVGLLPDIEEEPTGEVLMACYPPEADFIVQSRRDPARVTSYETYVQRRNHFDAVKNKVYPRRGWKPMGTA